MAVKWTKKALFSLQEIAAYIEADNSARARSFVQEIRAKTLQLEAFPGAGRPGRIPGTRELIVHKNYIVPYRVRGDDVEILRVHHVARRYP